jgi:F-type H+-transporting ATPase subunit epsilon
MKLSIMLPTSYHAYTDIERVRAEGEEGSITFLPKHGDYATGLVPGILEMTHAEGKVEYAGIDRGALIKAGDDVTVVTPRAILEGELGKLRQEVEKEYRELDEREKRFRTVLARLETELARRFFEADR